MAARKKKTVKGEDGKSRRRLDRGGRRHAQGGGPIPPVGAAPPGGATVMPPGGALTPQQTQMLQARRAQMMGAQGGMPPGGAPAAAAPGMRPPGMGKGGKTPNFHPGGEKGKLHREMGIPEGEKIPAGRLEKAAHSGNPEMRRDAIRAQTMKKWHHTGPKGD